MDVCFFLASALLLFSLFLWQWIYNRKLQNHLYRNSDSNVLVNLVCETRAQMIKLCSTTLNKWSTISNNTLNREQQVTHPAQEWPSVAPHLWTQSATWFVLSWRAQWSKLPLQTEPGRRTWFQEPWWSHLGYSVLRVIHSPNIYGEPPVQRYQVAAGNHEKGKIRTLKELHIFWEEAYLWFITRESSSGNTYHNRHWMLTIYIIVKGVKHG